MKKLLTLALALAMIFSCLFVFASCDEPKPELDLEDAVDNLENEDYEVTYDDDVDDVGIDERLSASNDDDEHIMIIVFQDSKLAKMYYEELKASVEYEKESLERELEMYEHMLKKYEDDLSNSEIDEMEDDIKALKKDIKTYNHYVIGRSGKTVWVGTEDAIEDSQS